MLYGGIGRHEKGEVMRNVWQKTLPHGPTSYDGTVLGTTSKHQRNIVQCIENPSTPENGIIKDTLNVIQVH